MNFSAREMALLMLALDNTSSSLRDEAARGNTQTHSEAVQMEELWSRIMLAREDLLLEIRGCDAV